MTAAFNKTEGPERNDRIISISPHPLRYPERFALLFAFDASRIAPATKVQVT